MTKYRPLLSGLSSVALVVAFHSPTRGQQQEVDLGELATATCELIGLVATPPQGWINVPIDVPVDELAGCQMMLINDKDELVSMIRILSRQIAADTTEESWFSELLGLEVGQLEEMGVVLGEPMWKRDDVPVTGPGFGTGRAAGFAASIEGNPIPQEVHFVAFGKPTLKYLVTLITPGRTVEDGLYYDSNTADFGSLIQTLQFPAEAP